MSTTGIKLDKETKKRLKALGEKLDRSPHWIMKTAIESYIDEQERYWQEREKDMKRWEHYMLTGESVPHEKVSAWLDTIGTDKETECPK